MSRIVFRGVDWHTYSQLSESLGEKQRVHLVYDGKDLEIMVIGNAHEILKDLISRIVTAVAMGLGLRLSGFWSGDMDDQDSWPRGGSVLLFRR